MTNMCRATVTFTPELRDRIFALRKDDRFTRCSYSDLVRMLAEMGLEVLEQSEKTASGGAE